MAFLQELDRENIHLCCLLVFSLLVTRDARY